MLANGSETGGAMHENDLKIGDDVLEKVSQNLQNIGSMPKVPGHISEDGPETDDDTSDSSKQEELEDSDLTPDDTDDEVEGGNVDDDGDTDGEEADGTDDTPVIPDALYRAAEHSSWKPEEIVEFWKSNPEFAEKTFTKLHSDMVNLNTRFADQGRISKKLKEEKRKIEQEAVEKADSGHKIVKSIFDAGKAKEEFGDGAQIIQSINDSLVSTQAELARLKEERAAARESGVQNKADEEINNAVVQQIKDFFNKDDMDIYAEFYGSGVDADGNHVKNWDHLTPGQKANRRAAVELADDIMTGMEMRGESPSIEKALESAHLVVTANMSSKIARNGIMKQVRKRSKGITLRPSDKKIKKKSEKLPPGYKISQKQIFANAKRRIELLNKGKKID